VSNPEHPQNPGAIARWLRGGRLHFVVLAGFALLACAMWWPLPLHITTHVPGVPQWAYDEATFLWNIWAFKDAVIDGLRSPLHSDLIYYPLGIDLILYTYNFYHVLASLPLALAVNIPFASNVSLLASTALSGYGMWLLARYGLAKSGYAPVALRRRTFSIFSLRFSALSAISAMSALVAGIVFAFGSNRAIYAALGHYDMVTTQWLPFYALMLLRSFDGALSARVRYRAAALAGLFFALTGLAEMILALFLGLFTVIVVLFLQAEREGSAPPFVLRWRTWLPALTVTGVVAFLVWSPALVPILRQFVTNDFSLKGWGEAIPLSADLLSWVTPTALHPLFGTDVVAELRRVQLRAIEESVQGFRDINTVFVGWVTLALAVAGAFLYRRSSRIWWMTALLFGIFTFGPFLQINGEYRFDLDGVEATFPLPFAILHWIPVIKANRAPNRNSVILMMAVAMLASFAVAWLLAWWAARKASRDTREVSGWMAALPAVLIAGVLFEHAVAPMPLTDVRVPVVYEQIAADSRPVSVLNVPLGWRNSFGVLGPESTLLQYYQTVHGKPMLGGNISRAPDFKMAYFERIPWFKALTEIEFGNPVAPEVMATAQEQGSALAALYNIGYVILHPPVEGRPPYSDHWQAAWEFVRATLPLEEEPFWTQDGIEAYRVILPEDEAGETLSLQLADSALQPLRGDGWEDSAQGTAADGEAVWATAGDSGESVLFATLQGVDVPAPYRIVIEAQPFTWAGAPQQSALLSVNGVEVGAQTLPANGEWSRLTWEIPPGTLHDGLNRLALRWAYTASPREVRGGSRQIGSTGVELPMDADLKAFADGGFIALFDEETGEQSDGSAGRKGINLTTIDPKSGEVIARLGFDTTANAYESDALVETIQALPGGVIALVVSNGEAWNHLTAEAVDALRSLGLDVTQEGLQGRYLAGAGVKGAAPGSGATVIDPNEAFLRISLDHDRRQLAAMVRLVEVGKAP